MMENSNRTQQEDEVQSEDLDDSDVERTRREDERGRTVLALVGKATQNGTKIPLQWHPVYKIPCGEYKAIFSTYVGVVVRERVCITYSSWKKVPKEIIDELYDCITKGFIVPVNRRKYILCRADEKWKAFKTRLRNEWLYHKKSGRLRCSPPWKYPWITKEVWNEFKRNCLDENFQKKREEGKRRASLKKTSYRGGRLGYQYFEEEIRKELLEQGIHVDQVPRHETWLRAHSRKKNDDVYNLKNPIDQEVANAIKALKAQAQKGEIAITTRRDDILAKAIKTPETAGRVRAVGTGIKHMEYFGSNTPTSSADLHAQIQQLQMQQNLMMSFIMSGGTMNQEQMRKMIGRGQINNQYGDSSGLRTYHSGGISGQGNSHFENTGQGLSGAQFKEYAEQQYEGGFFTNLLSGRITGHGSKSNGDTNAIDSSVFQTASQEPQPAPYKVPWPELHNMHSDERHSQHEQPWKCQQTTSFHQPENKIPSEQPSISLQPHQSSPYTSEYPETDYDTLPLSNQELPEGLHDCCLAIEVGKQIQIVAIGEVYIPAATEVVQNHFNRVQIGCRRVSVTKDIVPTASLPCPTKEFTMVCQAVDTFVSWPTYLIFPKKKQLNINSPWQPSLEVTSSRKYTHQDLAKVTSGLLDTLKKEAISMKKSGKTIQLTIPESVYCKKHEVMLDYEDILDWCFQRQIGASHISIFMRELSETCKKDGISGVFGFVDPNYISPLTPTEKEEERIDYLCHTFGCNEGKNRDQLFFAPYHENDHWMLAAVSPWNGLVFWLDPAGRENEIHPFAQRIINEGIKKFSMAYRKDIKKVKKNDAGIKWLKRECPRQPEGSVDCGYYVCRYMKDTVANRRPMIPDKYFQDIKTFSQEVIDEIRDSLATYIFKNKEVAGKEQGQIDELDI